jgi:hypothetical protein
MTKKQKRSSRKNMQNRSIVKYLKNRSEMLMQYKQEKVLQNAKSQGRAASLKRASGRGE